jgi:hypothetical protein
MTPAQPFFHTVHCARIVVIVQEREAPDFPRQAAPARAGPVAKHPQRNSLIFKG